MNQVVSGGADAGRRRTEVEMSTRPGYRREFARLLVATAAFLVLAPSAIAAASGQVTLVSVSVNSAGFGGTTTVGPTDPRYQTLAAPDGSGANGSSGEFNIGFDP